jgi:hypothetical protein
MKLDNAASIVVMRVSQCRNQKNLGGGNFVEKMVIFYNKIENSTLQVRPLMDPLFTYVYPPPLGTALE